MSNGSTEHLWRRWGRWWLSLTRRLGGAHELAGLPTSQQRAMARWQEELVDQLEQVTGTGAGTGESLEALARLRADIQTISRAPLGPEDRDAT